MSDLTKPDSTPVSSHSSAPTRLLRVGVAAMDLRFAHCPILCGHYSGDAIAGAESQIDRSLVQGALRRRERLGAYAGEIGTSAVVLIPRTEKDVRRGTGKGAVIVGLGEWGKLSAREVTETVRAGVVQYLLASLDCEGGRAATAGSQGSELALASLLIGYNSTTNISVEGSVEAIVRGVCAANRQFEEAMGARLWIGQLEFLELFLDAAITAASAVRSLPRHLEHELKGLGTRIEAAGELREGDGVRPRLQVSNPFGYWPRLIVTDPDRNDEASPPPPADTVPARRLKYVLLSERARAEAVIQQRQPGLIESLIRDAVADGSFHRDISRTLFQLMLPLDLKGAVRQTERLLLALDSYTADLPWEMLQADDEPLVLRTALVRQFVSTRRRQFVRSVAAKTAFVLGDPSTEGFFDRFDLPRSSPGQTRLEPLTAARDEAETICGTLEKAGYQVTFLPPDSKAVAVLNGLFDGPYRILAIAAHGLVNAPARDGLARTGVVLSDGILLTAAEVALMEVVPDLVFLNGCHLGELGTPPLARNQLAYSLARELIEMGVRCVVAAGWAVNDAAACRFAEDFFQGMVAQGRPFGDAVWEARKANYRQYPDWNTWGAYQAYGDPSYRLDHECREPDAVSWQPLSPRELIDRLERLRVDRLHDPKLELTDLAVQADRLLVKSPMPWRDLPEVQAKLGDLLGDSGQQGFKQASETARPTSRSSPGSAGAAASGGKTSGPPTELSSAGPKRPRKKPSGLQSRGGRKQATKTRAGGKKKRG